MSQTKRELKGLRFRKAVGEYGEGEIRYMWFQFRVHKEFHWGGGSTATTRDIRKSTVGICDIDVEIVAEQLSMNVKGISKVGMVFKCKNEFASLAWIWMGVPVAII